MKAFVLLALLSLLSMSTSSAKQTPLATTAKQYFQVYAQRNNFNEFMSYYADDAQFIDMIYGIELNNRQQIAEFLDWQRGKFSRLHNHTILTVTKQTVMQQTVVTQGYFHTFSYNEQKMGPWHFVIIQHFNQNNQIIQQTDWINYTPKEQFLGGKDLNQKLITTPRN